MFVMQFILGYLDYSGLSESDRIRPKSIRIGFGSYTNTLTQIGSNFGYGHKIFKYELNNLLSDLTNTLTHNTWVWYHVEAGETFYGFICSLHQTKWHTLEYNCSIGKRFRDMFVSLFFFYDVTFKLTCCIGYQTKNKLVKCNVLVSLVS